jgi:hypothetical protein
VAECSQRVTSIEWSPLPVKYIFITNKDTGHFGVEVFTVVLLRISGLVGCDDVSFGEWFLTSSSLKTT